MNLSFPSVALLRSSGLAAEAIQQRWTLAALSAWWRTAPSSLAPFHRELATHGVADTSTGTSGLARFYKNVSVKETDSVSAAIASFAWCAQRRTTPFSSLFWTHHTAMQLPFVA
jgi:hypothetical protein